jgi:RNA recognition motif-containing protein
MQSNKAPSNGTNLYVKHLAEDVDDDKLLLLFAPFGIVKSAKVMSDDNGRSKGFGFVNFSSPAAAARAVVEMHGKLIGTKPLYVSLAQRKEDRQARNQNLAGQRLYRINRMLDTQQQPLSKDELDQPPTSNFGCKFDQYTKGFGINI